MRNLFFCLTFFFSSVGLFANDLVLEQVKRLESRVDEYGLPGGLSGVAKGYHTNVERGTRVHGTRPAAEYAAWLLASPNEEHRIKGNAVLARLLDLQDRNPESRTFGIW